MRTLKPAQWNLIEAQDALRGFLERIVFEIRWQILED